MNIIVTTREYKVKLVNALAYRIKLITDTP